MAHYKPEVIPLGRGKFFVNGILSKRVRSGRRRSRPANPSPKRKRLERRKPETEGWHPSQSVGKRWRLRFSWQSKACSYCHLRRWSNQVLRMETAIRYEGHWVVRSRPATLEPHVPSWKVFGAYDPAPPRLCQCPNRWPFFSTPPHPICPKGKKGLEHPSILAGNRKATYEAV